MLTEVQAQYHSWTEALKTCDDDEKEWLLSKRKNAQARINKYEAQIDQLEEEATAAHKKAKKQA